MTAHHNRPALVCIKSSRHLAVFFILCWAFSCCFRLLLPAIEQDLQNSRIHDIDIIFNNHRDDQKSAKYAPLIDLKKGDFFSFKKNRKSMENLFKTGSFDNIEARVERLPDKQLKVIFAVTEKFMVRSIAISMIGAVEPEAGAAGEAIKKKSLANAIFSLRGGAYFSPGKLAQAREEILNFMKSRGCFGCEIDYRLETLWKKSVVNVTFLVKPGQRSRVSGVTVTVPESIKAEVEKLFKDEYYLPYLTPDKIESIRTLLRKQDYYFPEIRVTPDFQDQSKTTVVLQVIVKPGFKYVFEFRGMDNKLDLISTIWARKRFEKWAEKESRARILYYLHNKGYLDATIESNIETREIDGVKVKYITFTAVKNKRYRLGKIQFLGNEAIADEKLEKAIKTDDMVFDSLFWLRAGSLLVDLGVLEQYYHFNGFPLAEISMKLDLRQSRAGIDFHIVENEKFTADSISFEGNRFFTREQLLSYLKTKEKEAFVQQVFARDIENLVTVYHAYGFDRVEITPEISPGAAKSIAVRIKEGKIYEMGNLVILGASGAQERLIKQLFPISQGSPFNRDRVASFTDEITASAIFYDVKISYLQREKKDQINVTALPSAQSRDSAASAASSASPDTPVTPVTSAPAAPAAPATPAAGQVPLSAGGSVDVLVKVIPDRSKYYGFGVGWEDRKGLRGTVEYQGKNIFNSTSSFSAMAQLGINERRGLLSYDTPYFFKNNINSSFKAWIDSEVYPSYSFNRYGLGESLIRKLSPNAYIQATVSWYRTELTELRTDPHGIDKLNVPFDTTAVNFSYVRERRDDPFNPSSGDYFSSDIKVGIPLFEKSYSFIKFLWSYQRNFKFLKYGTLAFSVRNGFASGDMSITERFFAGGVHTFRGTKNDYLSPVDEFTGKPKGGNALVLFNVEATFPFLVIPSKDLYYSIFFDTGNVFEKVNDFDMTRLERAIGFSLKIKTEMGPIRVDFGWNLVKNDFEWNVGIGNVF